MWFASEMSAVSPGLCSLYREALFSVCVVGRKSTDQGSKGLCLPGDGLNFDCLYLTVWLLPVGGRRLSEEASLPR